MSIKCIIEANSLRSNGASGKNCYLLLIIDTSNSTNELQSVHSCSYEASLRNKYEVKQSKMGGGIFFKRAKEILYKPLTSKKNVNQTEPNLKRKVKQPYLYKS